MKRTKHHTNGSGKGIEALASNIQGVSELTTRMNIARQLGEHYGGDRDIYEALGYNKHLSFWDYLNQYRRQDIAKAVIDRPVKATWRGGIDIKGMGEEEAIEDEWKALNKRLKLVDKLVRFDKMIALSDYAVMLLGFDDSRNNWTQPVTEGSRQLLYVKPIMQGNVEIMRWEEDPANERYGLPSLYRLTLRKPGTQSEQDTYQLTVHHTRVLHVAADKLEDETQGESSLKPIFNRLKDLEKLVGGSAEMFWRGARPGYKGEVKPDFKIGDEERNELEKQIEEYEHNLRRFLTTEGVDIQSLAQQVSDPANHVDVQIQMISAFTGIPKRILTGSERGELSSSQDQSEWREFVQDRREEHAEPLVVRPFVDKMIKYGVFTPPSEDEDQYTVEWSDIFAPSEKEKVDIGKTRTDSLKTYTEEPAAEQVIPLDVFLKHFLGFDDEKVEQIKAEREEQFAGTLEEEIQQIEEDEQPEGDEDE